MIYKFFPTLHKVIRSQEIKAQNDREVGKKVSAKVRKQLYRTRILGRVEYLSPSLKSERCLAFARKFLMMQTESRDFSHCTFFTKEEKTALLRLYNDHCGAEREIVFDKMNLKMRY